MSRRVVVIGAGIAGLTAAYRLHRLRSDLDVVVLESSARTGGKVLTTPFAGHPGIDAAADAFLTRTPAAIDLCRELGLDAEFVHPASRSAFVWHHRSLHRLPTGLMLGVPTDLEALRGSSLVSEAGIARATRDLENDFGHPPATGADESVGALVRRRLGDEIFDVLVSPLLSGVNAGSADRLSLRAGAPQLAAAVRDQPSLIAGSRALLEAADRGSTNSTPVFTGLRTGANSLTNALAHALPTDTLRLDQRADAVVVTNEGASICVTRADGSEAHLHADGVIFATPAGTVARLLGPLLETNSSEEMSALEWASVAMITLAVPLTDVEHPLDGSGFLVADHADLEVVTACSFGSSKWAHWADGTQAILRVSAGRWGDERALAMPDRDLVAAVCRDLQRVIGLQSEQLISRVTRWHDGLPQYLPGHLDRVTQWRLAVAAALPVAVELVGASYEGLGLPACIAGAESAAASLAGRA